MVHNVREGFEALVTWLMSHPYDVMATCIPSFDQVDVQYADIRNGTIFTYRFNFLETQVLIEEIYIGYPPKLRQTLPRPENFDAVEMEKIVRSSAENVVARENRHLIGSRNWFRLSNR